MAFGRFHARRPLAADETATSSLPQWRKIIVPAFGAPYCERAIRAACRLADGTPGEVRLVYVMEVPRALAIATPLPGEEALADQFLDHGRQQALGFDVSVSTDVIRGREAVDTLIRYLKQNETDLLVIGSLADEVRGLPLAVARRLFSRAPCDVILDYVGVGETPAPA